MSWSYKVVLATVAGPSSTLFCFLCNTYAGTGKYPSPVLHHHSAYSRSARLNSGGHRFTVSLAGHHFFSKYPGERATTRLYGRQTQTHYNPRHAPSIRCHLSLTPCTMRVIPFTLSSPFPLISRLFDTTSRISVLTVPELGGKERWRMIRGWLLSRLRARAICFGNLNADYECNQRPLAIQVSRDVLQFKSMVNRCSRPSVYTVAEVLRFRCSGTAGPGYENGRFSAKQRGIRGNSEERR